MNTLAYMDRIADTMKTDDYNDIDRYVTNTQSPLMESTDARKSLNEPDMTAVSMAEGPLNNNVVIQMFEKETLLELEEISPHDFFSKCEAFESAAVTFFEEADLDDAFELQNVESLPEEVFNSTVSKIT